MAVANRNPHRLQYLVAVPGYEDENGNYHAGSSEWKGSIPCDAVPSGKAEERKFEDGVVRRTHTTPRLRFRRERAQRMPCKKHCARRASIAAKFPFICRTELAQRETTPRKFRL